MNSLTFVRQVIGSQCNCLSSCIDGENRGALRTARARQFYTRWNLAKYLLAMLFSNELVCVCVCVRACVRACCVCVKEIIVHLVVKVICKPVCRDHIGDD